MGTRTLTAGQHDSTRFRSTTFLVALAMLLAALVPTRGEAAGEGVLMVVDSAGAPTPGETAVIDRLVASGYAVTVASDEAADSAQALANDLVVLSSRVSTSTVDSAMADVATPVLVAKPWLFDDYGLTAAPTSNYGSEVVSSVTIVDSAHPAAGGLSGSVVLGDGTTRVSWGTATAAATTVATSTSGATIAVLEAGALREDGSPAPACRLMFPLFTNEPTTYLAAAWDLFDATIAHAVTDCEDDPPPPDPDGPEVILVSIDGLRSSVLSDLPPADLPTWQRMVTEGATTTNARTVLDETRTMPNHASMFTGRHVNGPGGHGVNFNLDDGTSTMHDVAGEYVASIFDVVHDAGLTTSLYSSKDKFAFYDRTWDAVNGAPDVTGADDGRDKIDTYVRSFPGDIMALAQQELSAVAADLTVIHLNSPDNAGHAFGWDSTEYDDSVRLVDGFLGDLLDTVAGDPDLADAIVVVTTDHGGSSTDHMDPTAAAHYTIPFAAWGDGVDAGADLYAINPTRTSPGTSRPDYTGPQPVRNADAANLLLDVLGLGTVPGSTINTASDLVVAGTPVDQPPTASIDDPTDGATVSGAITVVASAADDNGVVQVDLRVDGAVVATDTDGTDGWSWPLDTTTLADGPATLTATATDTIGQSTTSTAVGVTVDNAPPTGDPIVLYVVDEETSPTPGEAAVVDRLEATGHVVTTSSDQSATAQDALIADLVIISSDVTTGTVDDGFEEVAVPVLVAKPWLLDDMGLAPAPVGNYGSLVVASIDVVDPAHPMAGGATGSVLMGDGTTRVSWGTTVQDVEVVATANGSATIMALDAGALRADGTPAPACRGSFPLFKNEPTTYGAAAWNLFDAAITHLVGDCTGGGGPPPPAGPVLFGANPGGKDEGRSGALATVEQQLGRQLDVVRVFETWDSPFPTTYHDELMADDTQMVLSIRARLDDNSDVSWRAIADAPVGSALHDDMVAWADRFAAVDDEVWVSFNHEPEIVGNLGNGDSTDFRDAWTTFRSVFEDRGVTNVRWAWIMTSWSYAVGEQDRRHAEHWYPGDGEVDVLGVDAYNWADCREGVTNPWRTLAQIVEPFRQFALAHPSKDLVIAEWASTEEGGDKAAWILEAADLLQEPQWTRLLAVSYYNNSPHNPQCGMPFTSSPQATAALAQMGDMAFYGGTGAAAPTAG